VIETRFITAGDFKQKGGGYMSAFDSAGGKYADLSRGKGKAPKWD